MILADTMNNMVMNAWMGSLMILAALGIIAYIAGMETRK